MNNRGLTVFEFLIYTTILSIVLGFGFRGFQSFQNRANINNGVRTIVSALNTARYKSIEKNKHIKVTITNNKFLLMEKKDKKWKEFLNFNPGEKVSISINSNPVFFPTGFVSPLCSIYVENENYKYKVTISIAGRIKVIKK